MAFPSALAFSGIWPRIDYMVIVAILLAFAWKILNLLWFRPKKLERFLRQQGISGNSYRLLYGDYSEFAQMEREAKSIPLQVGDDILPKIFSFIHKTLRIHGKNSFMWMGPLPVVMITEPEHLRDIFTRHNTFEKLNLVFLVRYIAGGLLGDRGEKWAMHRRIVNPAFHQAKLKDMQPAFHLSCDEMICKWEELVSQGSTTEVDVVPFLDFLSGDAISRTAFGRNYENGRRIFQLLREQGGYVTKAIQSFYIPGWRFVPTKMHRRMEQINNEIKGIIKEMIKERQKAMKMASENNFNDLLSLLLDSNQQVIQESGHKQKNVMTIDEIVEECKIFFSAGQETTSSLLVWTLVLLGANPEWQTRAREEVMRVYGQKKPDYDGLRNLRVITMILFEVLRLYPPATAVMRTIEKDTQLGGLLLPAGMTVFLPILMIHRDTEVWGEDAADFNPWRFEQGISKATKGRISFLPFGWGPRSCIGQNFALIEAKLALSIILQRFMFELSPSYSHNPLISLVLQPENGAHLLLSKY